MTRLLHLGDLSAQCQTSFQTQGLALPTLVLLSWSDISYFLKSWSSNAGHQPKSWGPTDCKQNLQRVTSCQLHFPVPWWHPLIGTHHLLLKTLVYLSAGPFLSLCCMCNLLACFSPLCNAPPPMSTAKIKKCGAEIQWGKEEQCPELKGSIKIKPKRRNDLHGASHR